MSFILKTHDDLSLVKPGDIIHHYEKKYWIKVIENNPHSKWFTYVLCPQTMKEFPWIRRVSEKIPYNKFFIEFYNRVEPYNVKPDWY